MADFIGVENGRAASGYLIANGNVYPAASGSRTLQDIPQGHYTYGGPERLSQKQHRSMTDGSNPENFRKFHIGTGPNGSGDIPDKRIGRKRVGIEFHYDGGNPGTAGCIGYQDPAAKNDLIADPNKSVNVNYVGSDAEARALVEQKLGHKVDWSKVKPRKSPAGSGSGTHTQSKKGHKVKQAHQTVLSGPRKRHTAHRKAKLHGGHHVTHASRSVFVGHQQHGVSRVADMTTDGSPLADGESSILVG